VAAAAHKLSADGADMDLTSTGTHDAVCAYIGSCAELEHCRGESANAYCEVLPNAIRWEQLGETTLVSATGPGGGGRLAWPTPPRWRTITAPFGEDRGDHIHAGVDIPIDSGKPIVAAEAGTVTHVCRNVSPCSGYGNFVCVQHQPELSTCYAHLESFARRLESGGAGARVLRGEVVGRAGSTGNSTGPHLHFEVRLGRYPAAAVDPVPYLEGGQS
jgi:Meckel syndrome type 1 protein